MSVQRWMPFICASALLAIAWRAGAIDPATNKSPATSPAVVTGAKPPNTGKAPAADISADSIETLPGFKVEIVLRADREKHGSWISMAKDEQGRLLLGGQIGQPLTRLTLRDGKVAKEEVIKLPVGAAMGMLQLGDTLYVNGGVQVAEKQIDFGLHRFRDARDGTFGDAEKLREWTRGSSEHGAHALVLSPDKRHIYTVCGDQVPQPPDVSANSPMRYDTDSRGVTARQEITFMAGGKQPCGSIIRMDLDGKNPETFAAGLRNTYDISLNADGEIFGFDADHEHDWGTAWYRPTRVCHATAGADFGYCGKYPSYYEDTLPPVINIGIGSPTGVSFGYGAKFPAKYQKALFIMDWTYGRLMAVHLKPKGASYDATVENFIAPKSLHSAKKTPLNLTDLVIGDDGAMYFAIGGRNTQGCLLRVTYSGNEPTAIVDYHEREGAADRELRRKLESFNGKTDPTAVSLAWPHLGSPDRFIRFAARLAIESQPVDEWKSKATSETNPQIAIEAFIALARVGDAEASRDALAGLMKFPLASLDESLQLQKLRCIELAIIHNEKPSADLAASLVTELDAVYPSTSENLNNELSQILLSLGAPQAVEKTMKLVNAARTDEEQMRYMMYMRRATVGWTPALRSAYFSWFNQDRSLVNHAGDLKRWFDEAGRAYSNGFGYPKCLVRIRTEALEALTPEELAGKELAAVLSAYRPPTTGSSTRPAIAARPKVREWKMADLETDLDSMNGGRSFQRAQAAFAAAQCATCHAIAGTKATGGIGPDLTSIAARFRRRDILESMIEPSKVVSEQYADTVLRLKNGQIHVGRITEEDDKTIAIESNPFAPQRIVVKTSEIATRKDSPLSPMPAGLLDTLTKDEILDLVAYLEAAGKSDHPNFSPADAPTAQIAAPTTAPASAASDAEQNGFINLFNGKDLTGWEGLDGIWSVKDGAINGAQEKDDSKQTFLILTESQKNPAKFANFEMRLKYRFVGKSGNSGIQFRSTMMEPATFRVGGYQADIDPSGGHVGGLFDEGGKAGGRGTMAKPGFKTIWTDNRANQTEAMPAAPASREVIRPADEWNDMSIVANGPHISITINGHLMSDLIDQSPRAPKDGLIAIQLHKGYTMNVQVKEIAMRPLNADEPAR